MFLLYLNLKFVVAHNKIKSTSLRAGDYLRSVYEVFIFFKFFVFFKKDMQGLAQGLRDIRAQLANQREQQQLVNWISILNFFKFRKTPLTVPYNPLVETRL